MRFWARICQVLLAFTLSLPLSCVQSALPSSYFDLSVRLVGNAKRWTVVEPTWLPSPSWKASWCGNERQEKSDRRKAGRKGSGKNPVSSVYLKRSLVELQNYRFFNEQFSFAACGQPSLICAELAKIVYFLNSKWTARLRSTTSWHRTGRCWPLLPWTSSSPAAPWCPTARSSSWVPATETTGRY